MTKIRYNYIEVIKIILSIRKGVHKMSKNKKKKKKIKNLAGKIVVFSMLILMIASTIIGILAI